jgi:hypothetical protein
MMTFTLGIVYDWNTVFYVEVVFAVIACCDSVIWWLFSKDAIILFAVKWCLQLSDLALMTVQLKLDVCRWIISVFTVIRLLRLNALTLIISVFAVIKCLIVLFTLMRHGLASIIWCLRC